jgi:hypothetical protein
MLVPLRRRPESIRESFDCDIVSRVESRTELQDDRPTDFGASGVQALIEKALVELIESGIARPWIDLRK